MSKNLLTFVLFSVVLFLSVYSVWRISQPRILSPEEMKVNGYYGYGSFQELRDFNLIDHNGNIFTKKNLKEQNLNFLYFGYSSCPTECPVTMSELRKLINALREKDFMLDDKQWVLVTIDPERDSAKDINFYASRFDSSFVGLRAERPTLLSLTTQLNVAKVKPMKHEMHSIEELSNHVNNVILINKDAEYFGFFRPPFDISKLSLTYQSVTTQ